MKDNIKVNKNQIFWFGRAWTPFGLRKKTKEKRQTERWKENIKRKHLSFEYMQVAVWERGRLRTGRV